MKHAVVILISCVAVAGCSTRLHGNQSVSGGASTTATSSAISGSASVGGGKVAFSSGSVPAPSAPGGHAVLGNSATAVLVLGIVLVDAVNSFVSSLRATPAPTHAAARPASIADTCSCYGYKPMTGDR